MFSCRAAWTIAFAASLLLSAAAAQASVVFIDVNGAQGVPSAPDGNGNYWNAVTAVGPAVSLVDTSNAPTGWDVVISQVGSGGGSGLTGGLNNSIPAPSPYNVQPAYADGWYDNTPGGRNGQFTFSGLSGATAYRLTLWGARGSSWNDGTVTVTAGTPAGVSVLQENTLLALDLVPDASNQIAFILDEVSSGGPGGTNAVLSLMSLEDGFPLPPPPPGGLGSEIGVNFSRASSAVWTVLPPDASAGVVPESNWNNIPVDSSRSFGPIALESADGSLTPVTIESTVSPGWSGGNNGAGNATPDHVMMNGSLYFDNDDIDSGTITLSGLLDAFSPQEYSSYDLYVYFESNDNRRNMTLTVAGESITGLDGSTFGGAFLEAQGAGINANYAVFRGLTLGTLTIDAASDLGRAALAGLQIVGNPTTIIPEPSMLLVWSLLIALGIGAGWCRRRKRDRGSVLSTA